MASSVTAPSTGDSTVTATATTTIAVTVDTLLVGPVNRTDAGTCPYQVLPDSYLRAFGNLVWFTGNSYPGPAEVQNDQATRERRGRQRGERRHRRCAARPHRARRPVRGPGHADRPAEPAFTDDSGATDGLTVDTGTYKLEFLAFPFEAYGDAAAKAALMARTLTWFASGPTPATATG